MSGPTGRMAHVLDHLPEDFALAAPSAPSERDPHRGGCWFCRWIRHDGMRCLHPAVGIPTPFMEVRESGGRCGLNANLWERR